MNNLDYFCGKIGNSKGKEKEKCSILLAFYKLDSWNTLDPNSLMKAARWYSFDFAKVRQNKEAARQ